MTGAVLMVTLLCVNRAAYVSLVQHAPLPYTFSIGVDALIVALFVLRERSELLPLLAASRLSLRWLWFALLCGVAIGVLDLAAARFTHWLGHPLEVPLVAWFERHGAPAWHAMVIGLLVMPVAYVVGLQGHVQTRLAGLLGPRSACLVAALMAANVSAYPERLPFDVAAAWLLCDLMRRSSSVLACILAQSVAHAAWLLVVP